MTRYLVFAGALALAFSRPDATIAQHVTPVRVAPPPPVYHAPPAYRAPLPVYHAPVPALHPAPVVRGALPAYHPVTMSQQTVEFNQPARSRALAVPNPYRWGVWGWNHGAVWYPISYYWGYGFWGPWGLLATPTANFGSVVNYDTGAAYSSYGVGPESPGAQLLYDYGLTQTNCGPQNLVVIWGPGSSPICAYPSKIVGPGNYQADPATLTITPATRS